MTRCNKELNRFCKVCNNFEEGQPCKVGARIPPPMYGCDVFDPGHGFEKSLQENPTYYQMRMDFNNAVLEHSKKTTGEDNV
jgi:hypothetical protein